MGMGIKCMGMGVKRCLCRVGRCELSLPDRLRSASECVRRSHCADRHTPTLNALVGRSRRLNSHRHTRHDRTVLFASCLVCRCELDDCSERVQTWNFQSATVLSCRESNSHRRSGRDTDKTVLSCLAWRCEFALSFSYRQVSLSVNSVELELSLTVVAIP